MQGINCEYYNNYIWGFLVGASSLATCGAANVGQLINPTKIENNIYDNNLVAMGFSTATSVNCVDKDSIFGSSVVNTTDIYIFSGCFPDYIYDNVSAPVGGLVIDETYLSEMVVGGKIAFSDYDGVATDDRVIFTYGKTQRCNAALTDTTTLQGDTNSFRFCPTSPTDLFEYSIDIPTGNIQNKDMVVGIWVKIKSANYWAGTTYQMPRITITYDNGTIVYAEAAKTTDEQFLFVPFTPSTTTGKITMTRSGYTDATGTDVCFYWGRSPVLYPVGYILNNSNLDNWDLALPVDPPISTLFSAQDVWAVSATGMGTGTIGAFIVKLKNFINNIGLIKRL